MNIIPHRDPMLLVDSVEMDGEYAVSEYTIRENAFFTQGHFPGNPIVPGVILCEIMAQGGAILSIRPDDPRIALYAGLDKVQFKKVVRPGNKVVTRSKLAMQKGPLIVVDATATVDDKVCCKGRLTFILTENS